MKFILYTLLIFIPFLSTGQVLKNDSIPRIAPISYEIEGGKVMYDADMPPLNPMQGAPRPFYEYYWEFGDGNYSFKEKPEHSYKKKGTYEARLWATNNYDNGKPPASRPKSITIDQNSPEASINGSTPFIDDEDLLLKRNREPLSDQEMVLITSYKNNKNYVTNGRLYLFYNDKKFKNDNFIIKDTRMYNNEYIVPSNQMVASTTYNYFSRTLLASTASLILDQPILDPTDSAKRKNLPLTLESSKALYRDYQVITFDNMLPGVERNIFRTLKTTPEMIKDTAATVTLRSIYVPDDNYGEHTVKDTEMEIVTSHDPNKMSTNGRSLNYRLAGLKRIDFKIRFQNNGEGPASTIKLEVATSEIFDKSTLRIDGVYPECPICPKDIKVDYSCIDTLFLEDKIVFQFNRIYLPGSSQKNVQQKDSTKGFVKYSMKFVKNPPKVRTKGRTAIIFDKNEPIYTNKVSTKFTPGISIGAKAGYRTVPTFNKHKEYFIGFTLSPYKPQKEYFQAEILFSKASYDELENSTTRILDPASARVDLTRLSKLSQHTKVSAHIVPGSFRYTFSKVLALGVGAHMKVDLTSTNDQETTGEAFLVFQQDGVDIEELPNSDLDFFEESNIKNNFTNFQTGAFIGLNLGNVRIGPSLGVRYEYYFNAPNSAIQFYGIWKF